MYTCVYTSTCDRAKVFLSQIRRPIGTAFEVVLPALFLAVVVGIRYMSYVMCFRRFRLTYQCAWPSLTLTEIIHSWISPLINCVV